MDGSKNTFINGTEEKGRAVAQQNQWYAALSGAYAAGLSTTFYLASKTIDVVAENSQQILTATGGATKSISSATVDVTVYLDNKTGCSKFIKNSSKGELIGLTVGGVAGFYALPVSFCFIGLQAIGPVKGGIYANYNSKTRIKENSVAATLDSMAMGGSTEITAVATVFSMLSGFYFGYQIGGLI